MSFVGLFVLAGLAGFIFLAVLGLITLLTSPKTRDVAKILLGGLAAFLLLGILLVGLYLGFAVSKDRIQRGATVTPRVEYLSDSSPDAESIASETAAVVDPVSESENLSSDAVVESADADASSDTASEEAVAEEAAEPPGEVGEATTGHTDKPEESEAEELSLAPTTLDRPSWADRKPYKEDSVYYWPVVADPRPDTDEAKATALPSALNDAIRDYVATRMELGAGAAGEVHLDPKYVSENMVGEDVWIEPVETSFGNWVRLHALVKFDRETNEVIRDAWNAQRLHKRLRLAGGLLCIVLFVLAFVYCYLKIDEVTGGGRRGLLRFAAILVILGLMLVAAGVARFIA